MEDGCNRLTCDCLSKDPKTESEHNYGLGNTTKIAGNPNNQPLKVPPSNCVELIIKFKNTVHNQSFLTNSQSLNYLHQHLLGKAVPGDVQELANHQSGYVISLKKLKYVFGQQSRITQTYLCKVTKVKQISKGDYKGLLKLYNTISDCLSTLQHYYYLPELYSTSVLRQAVR